MLELRPSTGGRGSAGGRLLVLQPAERAQLCEELGHPDGLPDEDLHLMLLRAVTDRRALTDEFRTINADRAEAKRLVLEAKTEAAAIRAQAIDSAFDPLFRGAVKTGVADEAERDQWRQMFAKNPDAAHQALSTAWPAAC